MSHSGMSGVVLRRCPAFRRRLAIVAALVAILTAASAAAWGQSKPSPDRKLVLEPNALRSDREAIMWWVRQKSGYGPYLDRPRDWPAALREEDLLVGRTDLNGDGVAEILLAFAAPDWDCCVAAALIRRDGALETLFEFELDPDRLAVWVTSAPVEVVVKVEHRSVRHQIRTNQAGWRAIHDRRHLWMTEGFGWVRWTMPPEIVR